MRYDEVTGETTVFRYPSNEANGNTRDRQGRLVTCEQRRRRVTRVNTDLGPHVSGLECVAKLVLCGGLPCVIAGCDGDIHLRLDVGRKEVGTVGFVGHQLTAMEGSGGSDPLAQMRGGPEHLRPTPPLMG